MKAPQTTRGFTSTPKLSLLAKLTSQLRSAYAGYRNILNLLKGRRQRRTEYWCRGFIALTSVLILGAILLSITISIASRAITGANLGTSLYVEQKASALAHLCAEHALIELMRTLDYSGDESLTIGTETCDILTVEGSGNTDRTIQTTSTVNGYTKRVEVVINSVSPDVLITSWNEVTGF